jgi:iron complex transport system permease protein
MRRGEGRIWLPLAFVFLAAAMLTGVLVGPVHLGAVNVVHATFAHVFGLHSPLSGANDAILWELRLPRVILGALVGGTLAAAGASYQGVFRNPLADPYLLGAAAGAGLGATLVIAYVPGNAVGPVSVVPLAAFVGALTGVGLAYGLGAVAGQGEGAATLLLAGVAVASFLAAAQTAVQQAHSESLRDVYSWLLGQLGAASWSTVGLMLPYAVLSTAFLLATGRGLDVLSVGDDEATSLGIRPKRLRLLVLLAASLGTASAVAVSGLIGFVGLVVPHIVRRLAGGSYRTVLPVSLLGGGAFLVLADMVARTVLAPSELPIGVITAFVGAPFFAVLLRVGRGS